MSENNFDKNMNADEKTPISDKRDISGLMNSRKEYKTINLYKDDHQKLKFESAKSGRSIVDILSELINEKY
ncbi:hypothetical protein [Salinicoccus kekensis]|uniref:Antitoxin MazE n=1 Tax=Salinicoccus kekensis TaxID=714307 RepID=A0A285UXW3_9STAP|nr:hypothetical protein [Salinicoccus kekensis]SOC45081.1 hypothetical protein SAMN05878391_2590 [Salinicoccus kekensis]